MTETSASQAERSAYLLDGRRLTVADLITGGLLAPGARLRFDRVRLGEVHRAVITPDGQIALDDGQTFSSPSGAAKVAAGVQALDGWHAWKVESSGRTLDSLRQQLLDTVSAEAAEDQPLAESESAEANTTAPQLRHRFLKAAREKADSGNPEELTVRRLLELWGADGRDPNVSQRIEADLANHDLLSAPSFRKVTLDTRIELVRIPAEDSEASSDVRDQLDDAEQPVRGLTIGNLPSALGGVMFVSPTATFERAITVMLLNDYSQLAVLDGPRNLRGAVTWKSIAQARHLRSSARFSDAITEAIEVRYDRELREVLPALEASEFVFVRNAENVISGIVTTADVVHLYGELATPFFLIGELDQALRQVISKNFTIKQITSLGGPESARKIESFDDLSMGDYQRVLGNQELWHRLRWPLERDVFVRRLNELREIRNDVMHFNPDPLPLHAVTKLRNAIRVLHEYGD
jgi:predicted transcriptional regulator